MKIRNIVFASCIGALLVTVFSAGAAKAFFWNGPCAAFLPGFSSPHPPFAAGPGAYRGYGSYPYPLPDPRYANRYNLNRALRPRQSYPPAGATRLPPLR